MKEETPKRQARNVLISLFLGLVLGFAVVGFLLYRYNPTGQYLAKNVLLSPKTISKLWYSDVNPKTGGNSRFVFDKIVVERGGKQSVVSEENYRKFYHQIQEDKSLVDTKPFEDQFSEPMKILIFVRTESQDAWQAVEKVFQELQILPQGDIYRIQLHEDNPGLHWVYFKHPGIYTEVISKFGFEQHKNPL